MLKIRTNTEDWLECLRDSVSKAEAETGEDYEMDHYSDLADALCHDTLTRLFDAGVDYERAYQQSKGAFAIIQDGSQGEIDAFNKALESSLDELYPEILRYAQPTD